MHYGEDILDSVIRHRDVRDASIATKGFRHVTELGYDDLTYRVRCHFAAEDKLDFFEAEVMSLGVNILQSPIERAVFAFLKLEEYGLGFSPGEIATVLPGESLPQYMLNDRGVAICPQHQVEGYFLDFGVFINTGRIKLAFDLECDGLEFHGTTNSQISHDWTRDTVVSSKNFQIFRMSGSKINQHPLWAVEQFGLEVGYQIEKISQ